MIRHTIFCLFKEIQFMNDNVLSIFKLLFKFTNDYLYTFSKYTLFVC